MADKKIEIEKEVLEKVLLELNEIKNLFPEESLKIKVNNLITILSKASNFDIDDKSLLDIIYEKMREARGKNPELDTKLYMLYRSLSEGKTSEEDARQLFEIYLQMYPYDKIIY